MPHYAKCDVISGQDKKLKYLVNKTLERKETCITVLKVFSHNAINIFVS